MSFTNPGAAVKMRAMPLPNQSARTKYHVGKLTVHDDQRKSTVQADSATALQKGEYRRSELVSVFLISVRGALFGLTRPMMPLHPVL